MPHVSLEALDDHHGQPAYQIRTPAATYVLDRLGGGLSSLTDPDGREWIGYRPGDGPRGEYRGLPNAVHPGMGFHPGGTMCNSELAEQSDDHVVIDTTSHDGKWAGRWTFAADRATFTLTRAAGPYWWLYEGTPGGDYDEASLQVIDSTGRVRRGDDRWQERLPDPRGIAFVPASSKYALLLADRTDRAADVVDSYWSMEQAMTVFGIGRELGGAENPRWRHLTETPATLVLSLQRLENTADVPGRLRNLAAF